MKKILKAFLPLAMVGASLPVLSTLTSCKDEKPLEIEIKKNRQICYTHECTFNFESNNDLPKDTQLFVVGSSAGSEIYIDPNTTNLKEKKIGFRINSTVHYDKEIDFGLDFRANGTDIFVDDLHVYYVFEEEEYKDSVRPVKKVEKNVDSWKYNYKFQFSSMPLSSVDMRIVGGQTFDKLTLSQTTAKVVKEGYYYYLYVPVQLSYNVYENDFFTFNIEFSFRNSFGFSQVVNVNDLGCEFNIENRGEVPAELFKFEDWKLVGWQDTVSAKLIQHYSTMRIPNRGGGTVVVKQGAFELLDGDADTYNSITKLVIPKGIDFINYDKAFFHFKNLELLDLSEYDAIPNWADQAKQEGYKLFNTEKSNHKAGIVLCNDPFSDKNAGGAYLDARRTNWIKTFNAIGLGNINPDEYKQTNWEHNWAIYSVSDKDPKFGPEVTDESWFIIDENHTLTGINKSKAIRSNLKNIALIKIPDDVTSIRIDTNENYGFDRFSLAGCSFDPLRCNNPELVDIPIGRQLLLGSNLQEIYLNTDGNGAFYHAGIKGNIVFPDSLVRIDEKCFDTSHFFPSTMASIPYVPCGFQCGPNPSLKKIGKNAFINCYINYITLPASLEELGDELFSNTSEEWSILQRIDLTDFDDVPTTRVEADHPLKNLQNVTGVTRSIEIKNCSDEMKEKWRQLIKDWYDGENIPPNWMITFKI